MADQLKGQDAFAFDVLSEICKIDTEFTKDVAEQMQATFDAVQQAIKAFEDAFPGDTALEIAKASEAEEDSEGQDVKEE